MNASFAKNTVFTSKATLERGKSDPTVALLRLFKAVQVPSGAKSVTLKPHSQNTVKRGIENGYVLHPAINVTTNLLDNIEDIVVTSGQKANAAFHKSWAIIRDASMEQLVFQQIVHYMTTYGAERVGLYDQDMVYIPNEVLEVPELEGNLPLTVINALTSEEVLEKIMQLGGSGIALSQITLDDIMSLIVKNDYSSDMIEGIKNRELKALLYDYFDVAPTDPSDYLRFVIAKLTGESLVIKNRGLIEKIKQADSSILDDLLAKAPKDLASIFYRYKPLFLAMKSISGKKTFFNRLRKNAVAQHKPLPEDYLNSVTAHIQNDTLSIATLTKKLASASIFRKIRLANALAHRLNANGSIVYRVRNGRGWATNFDWTDSEATRTTLDVVLQSIADSISANVKGQVFYVPENISYALPATEKQFTGHFPTGTYVEVPEDLILGIHWENTASNRVDLDLSVISETGKFGWDSGYRSASKDVLFSGDITDAPAPNGATELFYLKKGFNEAYILMANYFNMCGSSEPVPTKILVASEKAKNFGRNYMVDPNNIVADAAIEINQKQSILGFLTTVEGVNRFYFANVGIGNSITAGVDDQCNHARRHLIASTKEMPRLEDVLQRAGATVVRERPDGDDEYVDLSPQALTKTSFLDILSET